MTSKLSALARWFREAARPGRPDPLMLLALLGLLARACYVLWTRGAAPHPDLGSFFPSVLPLTHPFDTSPREPLFVWWLWGLGKAGITTTAAIRLVNSFWFFPSFFLFFRLASRFLGRRAAWAAALLYAFLPAQVQSDTLGLRNVIETFGLLVLLDFLSERAARRAWRGAAALAALVLLRINYLGVGLVLAGADAWRAKSARPLLLLLPALLFLSGHLQNNLARNGSLFYSATLHTRYISNMEYLGQPGFPATVEEWQKDPYKERLSFRQWAFERHTPLELVRDSFIGLSRGVWDFYEKVYFSLDLPAFARFLLLGLYAAGFFVSLYAPGLRPVALWLLLFTLPYAFVSHVFWAGRYFTPFAPLALIVTARGGAALWVSALRRLPAGVFRGAPAEKLP